VDPVADPPHYFSENLVAPRIEAGACGPVARNSDHYTTETVCIYIFQVTENIRRTWKLRITLVTLSFTTAFHGLDIINALLHLHIFRISPKLKFRLLVIVHCWSGPAIVLCRPTRLYFQKWINTCSSFCISLVSFSCYLLNPLLLPKHSYFNYFSLPRVSFPYKNVTIGTSS
jgi:hypothetical protein